MQTDNLVIFIIWICTAAVNVIGIVAAVLLAIKSKQFSNMDFCRYLPLGPKTISKQMKMREAKTCFE